ncbi:hypothetical protein IEQ34_000699 [Dendrobium chrysotoxum]|uniref:Uncharacterized protein n=1 Tax=Dendrobium chrysotoxum TaxID=161865 RepID=A0AAV7HQK4_DENCH|nr:hypothetical protein IEQ34_000699 [Dendrobium chrysotoxum]
MISLALFSVYALQIAVALSRVCFSSSFLRCCFLKESINPEIQDVSLPPSTTFFSPRRLSDVKSCSQRNSALKILELCKEKGLKVDLAVW